MSNLAPGDLCVITDHWSARLYRVAGRMMVLLEIADVQDRHWAPYWRCSGVGRMSISHKLLRKIPPAPLDEDFQTNEETEHA